MSSESEPSFEDFIPEKCRDCPVAVMTLALSAAFEGSTGGAKLQGENIDKYCEGYDIAPIDAATPSPRNLEIGSDSYVAFSIPSHSQLARCAIKTGY